jgi:hypothetical protein
MRCLLPLTMIALLAPGVAAATKGPCSEDRLKLCKDAKANRDDIRSCLLQHADELSAPCAARLAQSTGREEKPRRAKNTEIAPRVERGQAFITMRLNSRAPEEDRLGPMPMPRPVAPRVPSALDSYRQAEPPNFWTAPRVSHLIRQQSLAQLAAYWSRASVRPLSSGVVHQY